MIKPRTGTCIAALLLFTVAPNGCAKEENQQMGVFVFTDRNDPEIEYTYAISSTGVFAQSCIFPGHTNRRFFLRPALAGKALDELSKWQQRPTQVQPPFVPEAGQLFRISIPSDFSEPVKTDYFEDNNIDLQKWLAGLRSQVVRDEYRINVPPDWVTSDSRIRYWLGM
jgi:hypothetical protein